ncbi:MAG: glycoside hydrolase family 3 protein [Bacteroidales bacterium]
MKNKLLLPVVLVLILMGSGFQVPGSEDADKRYFEQADSLLNLLTLQEKAGQMTNIGLTALTQGDFWTDTDSLLLDSAKMSQLLIGQHVGSVQNKGVYPPSKEEWHRLVKSVQEYVLAHSRHKIPVLFGMDGVHGANYTAGSTLFPQQIAMAATWNPRLTKEMAAITAYELRASSLPWNYAPVLDVSMQPLWGRIFETFGEDTYLNTVMGKAFVEGSQGSSVADTTRAAVCLKHFVGYGFPHSGKDRSPAYIPELLLRQYYIGPFREAIQQGALTVMINSGAVNGIPGHADRYLITDILKGELGLKGFVISDWQDVDRLADVHQVAQDSREAAKIAVMAGIDMSMVPYDASFATHIIDLVQSGEIPLSRIDDAVRRILFVKFKLGLFEHSWHDPAGYTMFGSEAFAASSYAAALEAITLLKNQNQILPLKQRDLKILIADDSTRLTVDGSSYEFGSAKRLKPGRWPLSEWLENRQ